MSFRVVNNVNNEDQEEYLRARIQALRAENEALAKENAELKALLADQAAKLIIPEY